MTTLDFGSPELFANNEIMVESLHSNLASSCWECDVYFVGKNSMGVTIRQAHIENFRSIQSLDVNFTQLSVFVGKNDCGKSNILRALNLFFNQETNPGTEFNFQEDYNFFTPVKQRKAKEIVVSLEIGLPDSYHQTNGQVIIWTKSWREDGLWSDNYFGQRISNNKRGKEVREPVEIPDKSNVHSLLRKIEFEYVPAVKDSEYFSDLRGRIYGIISEVAARTFLTSSSAFEQSIGDHLADLTDSVTKSLGFETRLVLPRDLYHIFERLDFVSGEKSISLDNRGDGIKARHIPLILKFMADKKSQLQQRGGQPISNIWAYEEPENNLEIGSAVQLADELYALAKAGTAQVLLSTHSPAFYDLGQRESGIVLNFVTRTSDAEGTIIKTDVKGIDESLGTLSMLAPRISEMIAQVRQQEAAKAEVARMAEENCSRIFVEGESDRIILTRALQLFFPTAAELVRFETKRDGAGHNYVIDMLVGWRSQHKHHPERPKAVGIVDGDAGDNKKEFNKQTENLRSAKCLLYPLSVPVRSARAAHFKVYASLETLYPKEVWDEALRRNQLIKRNVVKVCPEDLANRIIMEEARLEDELNPEWAYLVTHDFRSECKIPVAEYLSKLDDVQCRTYLANVEPLLTEALAFLGLAV